MMKHYLLRNQQTENTFIYILALLWL